VVAPKTPPSVIHHPPTVHWALMCQARCRVGQGCSDLQGVHVRNRGPSGSGGPRRAAYAEKGLVPRPNPASPLPLPTPARVQCWVQLGSTHSLAPGVLSSGGTDPGPQGPARPGPPIPTLSPSIFWPPGLCCVGPGPQARQKVHAGVYDLVSPIPVGPKLLPSCTCRSGLRAQHSRAHIPSPLYHNSESTQLPSWGLPSCAGDTRMHTHTQANAHTRMHTFE